MDEDEPLKIVTSSPAPRALEIETMVKIATTRARIDSGMELLLLGQVRELESA